MCDCLKGLDEWTAADCKAWFLTHIPESPYSRNGVLRDMSLAEARYLVSIHAAAGKCPSGGHRVQVQQ